MVRKRRSDDNGNEDYYKQRSLTPDIIKIIIALVVGGGSVGGINLFSNTKTLENEKRIQKLETQRIAAEELLKSQLETMNVKIDNLADQLHDIKTLLNKR